MTREELVIKIQAMAIQAGANAQASPLIDRTTLVELLLPRVIDVVTMDACKDQQQLQALRATHSIDITAGIGDFPTTIKKEFVETTYVFDSSIAGLKSGDFASYKRDLIDYGQGGSSVVASFSVQGDTIYYREAATGVADFTGAININAVTFPSLPASAGGTVDIQDNLLEQIIAMSVGLITEQIPLGTIGLDYTSFAQEGKDT